MEETLENKFGQSSQVSVEEVEVFAEGGAEPAHYVGVPGLGFGNMAADYSKSLADYVRTNAVVTEIDSVPTDGDVPSQADLPVVRYTESGKAKSVRAKGVLVTVSLGVLKAGSISFVPPLPDWKQKSIDDMGFGLTNKCMMRWNDPAALSMVPTDSLWFVLVTPEDETSGRWTQFFNPSQFKGVPALTAFIGGDEAREAEDQSDGAVLDEVMGNLEAMFPGIPRPDDYVVTRWGQQEHVKGATSFPRAGTNFEEDARNLQSRLGRIYFAGEATSADDYATSIGAWNTGEEAAYEMAERLNSE